MGIMVSMSGLDLSFMKDPPKKKRGRPAKAKKKPETYQERLDAIRARAAAIPSKRADFGAPRVMTDIKPFMSPIDGTEITSRSKLRAHEQRHGVKQCGDYKPGEIIAKENKRIEESLKGADMESISWE